MIGICIDLSILRIINIYFSLCKSIAQSLKNIKTYYYNWHETFLKLIPNNTVATFYIRQIDI